MVVVAISFIQWLLFIWRYASQVKTESQTKEKDQKRSVWCYNLSLCVFFSLTGLCSFGWILVWRGRYQSIDAALVYTACVKMCFFYLIVCIGFDSEFFTHLISHRFHRAIKAKWQPEWSFSIVLQSFDARGPTPIFDSV